MGLDKESILRILLTISLSTGGIQACNGGGGKFADKFEPPPVVYPEGKIVPVKDLIEMTRNGEVINPTYIRSGIFWTLIYLGVSEDEAKKQSKEFGVQLNENAPYCISYERSCEVYYKTGKSIIYVPHDIMKFFPSLAHEAFHHASRYREFPDSNGKIIKYGDVAVKVIGYKGLISIFDEDNTFDDLQSDLHTPHEKIFWMLTHPRNKKGEINERYSFLEELMADLTAILASEHYGLYFSDDYYIANSYDETRKVIDKLRGNNGRNRWTEILDWDISPKGTFLQDLLVSLNQTSHYYPPEYELYKSVGERVLEIRSKRSSDENNSEFNNSYYPLVGVIFLRSMGTDDATDAMNLLDPNYSLNEEILWKMARDLAE